MSEEDREAATWRAITAWETPCPARADQQHCTHWYDGGPCCGCHDPADPAAGADRDEGPEVKT